VPVISISYKDFTHILGKDIGRERLIDTIPMLGCDVARAEGDLIDLEFFPNRPDLYCVEGIARAMKAFLGLRTGMPRYDVNDSNIDMEIDPSVADVRAFLVCGIVRDLKLTDATIKSLMDMQEKLHLTVGRKRKKVSIGVHDLDRVKPPFTYKAVPPESVSFEPLAGSGKMNLKEILERHEKGIEFASILAGMAAYPVILDREGSVLSFPPIINGTLTQVTEETKNIFLDVTGTDYVAISLTLNIISTALAERGCRLESVVMRYPRRAPFRTPSLLSKKKALDPRYASGLIGLELSTNEIVECLRRMQYEVVGAADALEVSIPAFRGDILHEVDLVEDVIIGHSYRKLTGELPKAMTFGRELAGEFRVERARQVMIGLGFHEMMTLALTNRKKQFEALGDKPREVTELLNPVSEEQTMLRTSLLPSLLELLKINKHYELPQRMFETGEVVLGHRNERHLSAVVIHSRANFTEAKSLAEAVLRELGLDGAYIEKPGAMPWFIKGRGASVVLEKGGKELGSFGEVHPRVITESELAHPVCALEFNLDSW
jgi:phenylalanyl-tRNA synthetase beta chain